MAGPVQPQVGAWRTLARSVAANPISAFAILCVACTAAFLGYMTVWQTEILASPTWCAKALGAEKVAPGQTYQQALEALKSCNSLLMVQVQAIATDSHINHSAFALVLVVLIVVVIAGARLAFKLSEKGLEGDMSRDSGLPIRPQVKTTTTTEVAPAASPPPPAVPPQGDEE